MNLPSFVLLVLYNFIGLTNADSCRCLLKVDCLSLSDSWDFMKNTCIRGCTPEWEGVFCDRSVKATKRQGSCHCANKFDCHFVVCEGCEDGLSGFRCDKKATYTTDRNTKKSYGHWNVWNIFGYSVIGVIISMLFFCCICACARHKNKGEALESPTTRTEPVHAEPMWSTDTSARGQIYNSHRNTSVAYSASNTGNSSSQSLFQRDDEYFSLIRDLKQCTPKQDNTQNVITKRVAFSVTVGEENKIDRKGQIIVYTNVTVNIGEAYDSSSGIFETPVTGLYAFFFSVQVYPNSRLAVILAVNGAEKSEALAGEITDFNTGSNMVILPLKKGDRVWIQTHPSEDGWINSSGSTTLKYVGNSFSGYLIVKL